MWIFCISFNGRCAEKEQGAASGNEWMPVVGGTPIRTGLFGTAVFTKKWLI
jgi:hypothetical protein